MPVSLKTFLKFASALVVVWAVLLSCKVGASTDMSQLGQAPEVVESTTGTSQSPLSQASSCNVHGCCVLTTSKAYALTATTQVSTLAYTVYQPFTYTSSSCPDTPPPR